MPTVESENLPILRFDSHDVITVQPEMVKGQTSLARLYRQVMSCICKNMYFQHVSILNADANFNGHCCIGNTFDSPIPY